MNGGGVEQRKAGAKKAPLDVVPKRVAARTLEEQYRPGGKGKGSWWRTLLLAPSDTENLKISNTIRAYIMELVGVTLFALVLNMAVSLSVTNANTLLYGMLVGVLAFGSYYMVATWKRTSSGVEGDYELPRHLSYTVSLGHFCAGRLGFLYMLIYWLVQTAGAAIAGGFLYYFDNGVVPFSLTTLATPAGPITFNFGYSWAIEILGAAFIVFAIIYNTYLSPHVNSKSGTPTEEQHIQHGQFSGALMRGIWTTIFLNKTGYSFDGVIFVAGAIGTCSSTAGCLGGAGNAWPFYFFVPWIGVAGEALLYLLLIALFSWGRSEKQMQRRQVQRE